MSEYMVSLVCGGIAVLVYYADRRLRGVEKAADDAEKTTMFKLYILGTIVSLATLMTLQLLTSSGGFMGVLKGGGMSGGGAKLKSQMFTGQPSF